MERWLTVMDDLFESDGSLVAGANLGEWWTLALDDGFDDVDRDLIADETQGGG